jgi:hypothetical protein
MIVWSYGGGTQSVAIAVLIAQGQLPRPDMIVIADTDREASETWTYTDAHIRPLLAPLGLTIEIAPHSLATVDLYSPKGDCLLPAYTAVGKLPSFCSHKWKLRVVRRYMREQGIETCIEWLGISRDEAERMKVSDVQWIKYNYPLAMKMRMTRRDCVYLVERFGLPTPPRSSCWMCPNRGNEQWQRLKDYYPDEWGKACELDIEIRERDEKHGLYLHRSRVPLKDADLTVPAVDNPLLDCMGGVCWV